MTGVANPAVTLARMRLAWRHGSQPGRRRPTLLNARSSNRCKIRLIVELSLRDSICYGPICGTTRQHHPVRDIPYALRNTERRFSMVLCLLLWSSRWAIIIIKVLSTTLISISDGARAFANCSNQEGRQIRVFVISIPPAPNALGSSFLHARGRGTGQGEFEHEPPIACERPMEDAEIDFVLTSLGWHSDSESAERSNRANL